MEKKENKLYLSLDAGTTEKLWEIKEGAKNRKIGIEEILEGTRKIKESGNTWVCVNYVIT